MIARVTNVSGKGGGFLALAGFDKAKKKREGCVGPLSRNYYIYFCIIQSRARAMMVCYRQWD